MKQKYTPIKFEDLLGKTLTRIEYSGLYELHLYTENEHYMMTHFNDCCESVYLEDVAGDFEDLLNYPLLMAEEASNIEEMCNPDDRYDKWTFYKLATVKGYVTLKWDIDLDSWYSKDVSLVLVTDEH